MPFWHSVRRFVTTTLCHFGTSRGLALCHFGTAKKKKPPGVQRVHRAATWQIRNGGIRHEGHHKIAGRSRGRRTGSQTMNQRQRAFCEAYLKCGNAAEAAIKAGYSPKSARSIGQRLLTFADIREYLAQRNAQIIAENTATLEEIYSFWTVTMRDQASKPADRLKASELLSKALIVERTRKENSDQSGAGHEFDGWSDEELRGAVHLMEDLSDEEFNAIMDAYNRKKRR